MKTLHKFVFKAFLGPFAITFIIAMFVFFMFFIFKYIDDFVGKGLDLGVLLQLFFYFSLTTVPMALPLAILLSSLMTFGNMGEYFELTAMKSAGMSFHRIMSPLSAGVVCIAIAAFFFSNIILPYTSLKVGSLLYAIKESKPSLMLKEGVFNNSLNDFSIRIGKREGDDVLNDILIYDHSEMNGNNMVLFAKQGKMEQTPDHNYLIFTLHDGESHKEVLDAKRDKQAHPLIREKFEERIIRLDLSEFKLPMTNEELFKSEGRMLNSMQITEAIDSLVIINNNAKKDYSVHLKQQYYPFFFHRLPEEKKAISVNEYFSFLSKAKRLKIIEFTTERVRDAYAMTASAAKNIRSENKKILRYTIEWHRKFTISAACIILFFIGAPLGSIIRKGGFGMPIVTAIFLFLIFHVLSIVGEKLAKEEVLSPFFGMWMAALVLLPLGIYLTYKSTNESFVFNIDPTLNRIKTFFQKKNKKSKL